MRQAGMQNGEIGVAEQARLRRHLGVRQNRELPVGGELLAFGRGNGVRAQRDQQRGKQLLHRGNEYFHVRVFSGTQV